MEKGVYYIAWVEPRKKGGEHKMQVGLEGRKDKA